jgi:hypothetical protein
MVNDAAVLDAKNAIDKGRTKKAEEIAVEMAQQNSGNVAGEIWTKVVNFLTGQKEDKAREELVKLEQLGAKR